MKHPIEIPGTGFDVKAKAAALEILANLDSDTLTTLAKLSKNEKAVQAFKNPPLVLKTFLGI